ncbi:exopolysaccharide biosynthesis polyprenyl glycosylphosphotransferase [Sphingomonas canadensis]|uniref:exopolysaccharide biosynthesis polyprenyl glycosylphosphotransferase n=1 Tax=Sphingomonas canadensis TaxID=1219257 RepID=UPI00222FAD10|nr:exopolysaccharide biosynthesis polyprenyl glycosylphosphotransferase [Sphingomonas canadensis]
MTKRDLEVAELSRRPGRISSRSRSRLRLYGGLAIAEALAILYGFFLAGQLYPPGIQPDQWLLSASTIMPLYAIVALNTRAYSAKVLRDFWSGVARALRALLIAGGLFLLIAFCLKATDSFSRVTLMLGFGVSALLIATARALCLRITERVLGEISYSVALIIDQDAEIPRGDHATVLHIGADFDLDSDSPAMFDWLARALEAADRVVVACPAARRQDWVRILKGANVRSEIYAPELEALAPLAMGNWRRLPTVIVADGPLNKLDQLVKRCFDFVVAAGALVVFAPLMLVVAIAIKLESPGPVFFVQTRIGQGNRMFRMLKFRSMRAERSDGHGHASTGRDDDRITRCGAIIRKTSIDELPQLINVLLGDMSIVGPRPHALGSRAGSRLFWEIDNRYWHRHAAKPGLTGLAQVRGYRGTTEQESDLTDRLQADLEYLNDWSIWKDVKILFMTFRVLVHRNAY